MGTMHSRTISTAISIAGLLLASPNDSRAAASFLGLGDLPGGDLFSEAMAISADGSFVVGTSATGPSIRTTRFDAFRWTAATGMVSLGTLTAPGAAFPFGEGFGLSADGAVVVGESAVGVIQEQAFRWDATTGMVGLPDQGPGYSSSQGRGVSADGSVIVGRARLSNVVYEGFRWDATTGMVGLGELSGGRVWSEAEGISADGRTIVGMSTSASGDEAFRWDAVNGMIGLNDLQPGTSSQSHAFAASADGSVIAGSAASPLGLQAFRWDATTGMVGLGDLAGGVYGSEAHAVSADASVIVGVGRSGSGAEAFIWDAANGMRELDVVLSMLGVDLAGWTLGNATGISADGNTITGNGLNPDGETEAWIAVIPEPSTALLIGLGLAALARVRRAT